MKTEQQIKNERDRIKAIEDQYDKTLIGTNEYRYYIEAFDIRQTLDWVLGE